MSGNVYSHRDDEFGVVLRAHDQETMETVFIFFPPESVLDLSSDEKDAVLNAAKARENDPDAKWSLTTSEPGGGVVMTAERYRAGKPS